MPVRAADLLHSSLKWSDLHWLYLKTEKQFGSAFGFTPLGVKKKGEFYPKTLSVTFQRVTHKDSVTYQMPESSWNASTIQGLSDGQVYLERRILELDYIGSEFKSYWHIRDELYGGIIAEEDIPRKPRFSNLSILCIDGLEKNKEISQTYELNGNFIDFRDELL